MMQKENFGNFDRIWYSGMIIQEQWGIIGIIKNNGVASNIIKMFSFILYYSIIMKRPFMVILSN